MSHPKPIDLIEHVAGHAADAEGIREHLRSCPRCAAYVESIRATWETLGEMPSEQLTSDLLPRIEEALARSPGARGFAGGWMGRLRVAASIVVAAGAGHLLARALQPMPPAIEASQAAESIYLDVSSWRLGTTLADVILAGPDETMIGGNG